MLYYILIYILYNIYYIIIIYYIILIRARTRAHARSAKQSC
jgi:hypothetical protein